MPSGHGKGSRVSQFKKGLIPHNKGTGKGSIPRTCAVCGKTYFNRQETITCSRECGYKKIKSNPNTKVHRICVVCHKEFTMPRSWFKDKAKNAGNYCSRLCRFSKKIGYTDKEKQTARNKVTVALKQGKIYKRNCAICDNQKSEAHHYKGYAKENWLEIQWLCGKHHNQEHERLRRMGMTHLL